MNLTWHYHNADPEFGSWQVAELQVVDLFLKSQNLEKMLSHLAVSIIVGNKTLELRPSSVDKSSACRLILKDLMKTEQVDFLFCAGDGKTGEFLYLMW